MSTKSRKSPSVMQNVMQRPSDMTDREALALKLQAEDAGKPATPASAKSAQAPVVSASSKAFVDLLISRIAGKSAVSATNDDAVINVTADFVMKLWDYGDVGKDVESEFQIVGAPKGRRLLKINITLDDLAKRLPAAEERTRASGIAFKVDEWDEDVFHSNIAEDAPVASRLAEIRFNKRTRTGSVIFEDGVTLPIITRKLKDVYPSRMHDGVYTPARKSKNESSSNPEREVYVFVLSKADGSHEVLRDQGITNFRKKLYRRLDVQIVPNNEKQRPEDLFVWTPPKDGEAEADEDAEDDAE